VRRYIKGYNLLILAVLLEFCRVVALITVNNQYIVGTNSARLYMPVKVL
jgi:hypothetical protein